MPKVMKTQRYTGYLLNKRQLATSLLKAAVRPDQRPETDMKRTSSGFAPLILILASMPAWALSTQNIVNNWPNILNHWEQRCPQLKARFAQSPDADIMLTPLPELPDTNAPVWKLNWSGMVIPVPALDYTRIAISGEQRRVLLVTENQQYLSLSIEPAIVKTIAGRQTNTLEVMSHGYTVTPDDLACSDGHLYRQAFTTIALTLKTASDSLDLVAVHKVPGWQESLLVHGLMQMGHSRTPERRQEYIYLLKRADSTSVVHIIYSLAGQQPSTRRAALLLARSEKASFTQGPGWLQKLQAWLNNPTDRRLCRLADRLRQSGFDDDSIRNLVNSEVNCHNADY